MSSRLHEILNSVGVAVSILISFFGFYYEHIRTSEAVDALISNSVVKTDDMKKLESMIIDLILVK
jgi:hypothetical protein